MGPTYLRLHLRSRLCDRGQVPPYSAGAMIFSAPLHCSEPTAGGDAPSCITRRFATDAAGASRETGLTGTSTVLDRRDIGAEHIGHGVGIGVDFRG